MSKGGFGSHWNIKGEQSVGNKEDKEDEDNSDMRIAKRRQAESNKLAYEIFARDIGYAKCEGMSQSEFKTKFRPVGNMGDKADEMINRLWTLPIGGLKRSKKRKKTKRKKTKRNKTKRNKTKRKKTKSKSRSKRRSKNRQPHM
jgi:hypothetical protein